MKYRIATDTATIAGKYNDTPALNSSLNWAAGADAAEVKILWYYEAHSSLTIVFITHIVRAYFHKFNYGEW